MFRISLLYQLSAAVAAIDLVLTGWWLHFFPRKKKTGSALWLVIVLSTQAAVLSPFLFGVDRDNGRWITAFAITVITARFFALVFVLPDEIRRFALFIRRFFQSRRPEEISLPDAARISRSDFLMRTAAVASALPVGAMGAAVLHGAHDYEVKRVRIALPGLPKAFHGFKVLQLSDLHVGSFYNRFAVRGGLEMALAEKPDLLCITGDLINVTASELIGWGDDLSKLKAPFGVLSVRGNHDYADYGQWSSPEARQKNINEIAQFHVETGWRLLENECAVVSSGNEKLVVAGTGNWSANKNLSRANMKQARSLLPGAPVHVLLQHHPGYWDRRVNAGKTTVPLQLSGHTHGAQFGVEFPHFRWSPVQYLYRQWAGLYTDEATGQQLYINRGFGYLGVPARLGIAPEITVFELESA
jgi:predicted MPP superfamily phosphohydrolase